MIIGSHNSWSYERPQKWWLRPLAFIAKCQDANIVEQYHKYDVRCFDLRIRTKADGTIMVAHGSFVFDVSFESLMKDLFYLNLKGDCYVRILHEVRSKRQYTEGAVSRFRNFCQYVTKTFPNIRWWCGRNLYTWDFDYDFGQEPTCEEVYSSVCAPKIVDDWWPRLFAKRKNRETQTKRTNREILLIDFVNIR